MHDSGLLIEDKAWKHGRNNCLIIFDASRNTTITLVFYVEMLKIKLQQPTEEDVFIMSVNWLTLSMMEHLTQSIF